MKRNFFLLIVLLFITSFSLTACGKPSPASLGIERPELKIEVVYQKLGLGVYGRFNYDFVNKTAQIQVDKEDLSKIKEGYTVSYGDSESYTSSFGTVKSLPDPANADENGECTIEVALKVALNENVMLDYVHSKNFTVVINLPAKDKRWCIDNNCIQEGKDGKKYVWATKKKGDYIPEEDWHLKEVKTGETDGTRTEITDGLDEGDTIWVVVYIPNNPLINSQ
jgi:hypothetical protein